MIVMLLLAILILFVVLIVLRYKQKESYVTQAEVETEITNATTSAQSANSVLNQYDTAYGRIDQSFVPSALTTDSLDYIKQIEPALTDLTSAYGNYLSLANTNLTLIDDQTTARNAYVNALIDENLALAAQGNALAAKTAADLAYALADDARANSQSTNSYWSLQTTTFMNSIDNTLSVNWTGANNSLTNKQTDISNLNSAVTTGLANETRARNLLRDVNKIPVSYTPSMWGFTAPTTILTEATAKTNLVNANAIFAANYPSTLSGLIGWYDGDTWETVPSMRWRDKSGANNHVTIFKGTPTKVTSTLINNTKTFSTLQGTNNDGMTFPTAILPSTYTLFTVARYTDSTKAKRIFEGVGYNWFSGFHNARLGVAYHGGWITPDDNGIQNSNYSLTSWLLSSDVANNYWANGVNRKSSTSTASSNARLSINNGDFSNATYCTANPIACESSAWQVSLVLVYNRQLTDTERQNVEAWISYQYGLSSTSFTAAKSALALANLQYNQSMFRCSTTIPNMTMPIRLNAKGNAECLSENGTECKALYSNPSSISGLVGWYDGTSYETTIVGSTILDVGKANNWPFTTSTTDQTIIPSLPTSGDVVYTMDMELKINYLAADSCIFDNAGRYPALFVYPASQRKMHFVHNPQSAGNAITTNQQFTQNTWFRFSVVCNKTTIVAYINGVRDSSPGSSTSPMVYATTNNWKWNAYNNIGAGNTSIRNFRLYVNVAMTDAEILNLYTSPQPTYSIRWRDKSGSGNHATTAKGVPFVSISTIGNGTTKAFPILQGGTNDGLTFPTTILPATYTLFTVARYPNTTYPNASRIFDGTSGNWLSGFWGGNIGVAHHAGWVSSSNGTQSTAYPLSNWITSSDMNDNYWVNGVPRKIGPGNGTTNLTINNGQFSNTTYCTANPTYCEASAWQVALVLVYNRKLTDLERFSVEKWIANTYGITSTSTSVDCTSNILNTYTFNPIECATTSTMTTLPSWCASATTELTPIQTTTTTTTYTPTSAQSGELASATSALSVANSAFGIASSDLTDAQGVYNNQYSGLQSTISSLLPNAFMFGNAINYGNTYAPVARTATVGTNTVYMIQDGDATKMVNDQGVDKYYIGPMSNFSAANWNSYTNANGGYKLRLCPSVCTNGCDVNGNCVRDTAFMYGPAITLNNTAFKPATRTEKVGNNTVYMFQDGNTTKMVDNQGNAKYYVGPMANFNASNWSTYLNAAGNYKLQLCPWSCPSGCDVNKRCTATPPTV